jgi:selenocysteine-specific elongation factor
MAGSSTDAAAGPSTGPSTSSSTSHSTNPANNASNSPRGLVLGTAGHIDHGKTTLVAALTGVDTDRLPEEKARGITIDLGFAPLDLPDVGRLSVVDVPGHEGLVRTMVSGATGIDMVLLVVAADESVMPRAFSSGSLSVLTPVSASMSVVLPWSMCPAVPSTRPRGLLEALLAGFVE